MPFNLMYQNQFEIATDDTGTTFAPLSAGIKNVDLANNEDLDQTQYLSGSGFKETDVLSAQLTLAFTADRLPGDAAQDYIFGKLLTLGGARRTQFKYTTVTGDVFDGECTIANIKPGGGDAGAKQEWSFEVHFAAKPTLTPAV